MSDVLAKAEEYRGYLKEHYRLANLFVTDRFASELERIRIINETIGDM